MNRWRVSSLGTATLVLSIVAAGIAPAADVEQGHNMYALRCAFCHGSDGKGDGRAGAALKPPPTNFTSPTYWTSATPDSVRAAIENGKNGTAMMPFKGVLKPEEIANLIAYLDTFNPQR